MTFSNSTMKWALLVVLLFAAVATLTLTEFDSARLIRDLKQQVTDNYLMVALVFFAINFAIAALNLPGSGMLTIGAGAIFGLTHGSVLVSFSSALGSTVCMFGVRSLFRSWALRKFRRFSESVNKNIEKDGLSYLFMLRLVSIIPAFIINPVFGLSKMPVWQFYMVSQLGMLFPTIIYVNMGASVGDLSEVSISALFTPRVAAALLLLLCVPLLLKYILSALKSNEVPDSAQ